MSASRLVVSSTSGLKRADRLALEIDMKKLALVIAAFGTLAAGAAQADTTVVVHRDRPMGMGMHRMHHPMCRTVVKVVREHGHVRRMTTRVCR